MLITRSKTSTTSRTPPCELVGEVVYFDERLFEVATKRTRRLCHEADRRRRDKDLRVAELSVIACAPGEPSHVQPVVVVALAAGPSVSGRPATPATRPSEKGMSLIDTAKRDILPALDARCTVHNDGSHRKTAVAFSRAAIVLSSSARFDQMASGSRIIVAGDRLAKDSVTSQPLIILGASGSGSVDLADVLGSVLGREVWEADDTLRLATALSAAATNSIQKRVSAQMRTLLEELAQNEAGLLTVRESYRQFMRVLELWPNARILVVYRSRACAVARLMTMCRLGAPDVVLGSYLSRNPRDFLRAMTVYWLESNEHLLSFERDIQRHYDVARLVADKGTSGLGTPMTNAAAGFVSLWHLSEDQGNRVDNRMQVAIEAAVREAIAGFSNDSREAPECHIGTQLARRIERVECRLGLQTKWRTLECETRGATGKTIRVRLPATSKR
jgi:hypothetical protein